MKQTTKAKILIIITLCVLLPLAYRTIGTKVTYNDKDNKKHRFETDMLVRESDFPKVTKVKSYIIKTTTKVQT